MTYISECGGNYTEENGMLSSPLFPYSYPYNAECIYLVTTPLDTYINVKKVFFDISCYSDGRGNRDNLELRDGTTKNSPLIARVCGSGSRLPDLIQTTQNKLWIR